MAIERITFTCDILRPFYINNQLESATWRNTRWLEYLIGWQLSKAVALPQSSVVWKTGGFDAAAVYRAMQIPMGYEAWAALFYLASLPPEVERLLIAPFIKSCVIGCEIPDVLQMALTRNGIPFIDIISHPVRFAEDLLFGFRTNDVRIHAKLLEYQINIDDYCIPQANLIQAKVAWMPVMSLPPGTALITGQVATDKALISRETGCFLSLNDYAEKLQEIKRRHPLVLFKPHPYQDANCPSRRALALLGGIREVQHNFYYLVAQEGLTDVYAINSGTVFEANYFGRKGHALGDALYQFGKQPPAGGLTGEAIVVGRAFLEPTFWADVLQPIVPVQDHLPPGPSARPSLLRRSLNADWDYGFIDAVTQHEFKQ